MVNLYNTFHESRSGFFSLLYALQTQIRVLHRIVVYHKNLLSAAWVQVLEITGIFPALFRFIEWFVPLIFIEIFNTLGRSLCKGRMNQEVLGSMSTFIAKLLFPGCNSNPLLCHHYPDGLYTSTRHFISCNSAISGFIGGAVIVIARALFYLFTHKKRHNNRGIITTMFIEHPRYLHLTASTLCVGLFVYIFTSLRLVFSSHYSVGTPIIALQLFLSDNSVGSTS